MAYSSGRGQYKGRGKYVGNFDDYYRCRNELDSNDLKLKIDIPYFSRNLGIKDFIDWVADIDRSMKGKCVLGCNIGLSSY